MAAYDANVTARSFEDETFRDLASVEKYISYLKAQCSLGSGKAGFVLALILGEGFMRGPLEVRQALALRSDERIKYSDEAFVLLHDEAMLGDGEAMHFLAIYYQTGQTPLSQAMMPMRAFWIGKCKQTDFGRDKVQF